MELPKYKKNRCKNCGDATVFGNCDPDRELVGYCPPCFRAAQLRTTTRADRLQNSLDAAATRFLQEHDAHKKKRNRKPRQSRQPRHRLHRPTTVNTNGRGSHPAVRVKSAPPASVQPAANAAGTGLPTGAPPSYQDGAPVHGMAALGGSQLGCEAPTRACAPVPATLREDGIAHGQQSASTTETHSYRRAH